MTESETPDRIVYLLGAGATHACADFVSSSEGLLMSHLRRPLNAALRKLVKDQYEDVDQIRTLVNKMITSEADLEHMITFLDQSASPGHHRLARELRGIFERVLKNRLEEIFDEQQRVPHQLFDALLDMHTIEEIPGRLEGFLTLNYDSYLEAAIAVSGSAIDAATPLAPNHRTMGDLPVLKLHGSFDWFDAVGASMPDAVGATWIPPGIQKSKDRYPFNLLWGRAKELLDCEILRVVGCKLGANDWDLISLIFTTRFSTTKGPYAVEIIDAPSNAERLKVSFPYLNVRSILEIEEIGRQLIGEYTSARPRDYETLTPDELEGAIAKAEEKDRNWMAIWLEQMNEAATRAGISLDTRSNAFRDLGGVA